MTADEPASVFTEPELAYLDSQHLGRLATERPDGTLQVSPVGFTVNADGTIDIMGFKLAGSWKFRNIAANGKVAFVVDDLPSIDPWRVRCLEIRGTADAVEDAARMGGGYIRIHPRRIISFGIDEDKDAHELRSHSRNVPAHD